MSGAKVAVIGGGPLGLMALKNFLDDGFDTTLFESRAWVGGLWKYSTDSTLSSAENTIFNTSKYRTAISDFPVPEDMDDFPTAQQLHRYFESYCDHFNLHLHIRLDSPVASVTRVDKQWEIEVDADGRESETHLFDKVAFSCGPFTSPRKPTFEGIEKFAGKELHAINFHNASQFDGDNVLVVGAHASAQDIISQLSKHGKKVYLTHRSGVVMLPRYTTDGSVYDRLPPLNFTIFTLYLSHWFPSLFNKMMDSLIGIISKKGFPNPPDSLGSLLTAKPPSIAVAPPLIASEIYPHFESGFCEAVPEVHRIFGPRSVELSSGRILEDVDTIIYCTGYHSTIPVKLQPEELNPYPYLGSPPKLYRNIFPLHPDPSIRDSLAFLGQGAITFPGFSAHEAISMAVSQIWKGESSHLPPLSEMQKWHRDYIQWRANMTRKYDAQSTFYTIFVPQADHVRWVDEVAGLGLRRHFGLLSRWTSPSAWRFWWRDRKLYYLCLNGLTSPAIFKLFETGKRKCWTGAGKQILVDNERVERQKRNRLKASEKNV